jgi:dihydrolipoamide dehydrogenase
MSSADSYDLAVLGAGPGGYVAAIRAAQLGMRVAIIERDRLGGVCLNWGCIPSKALLSGAELVEGLRAHGEAFGISASGVTLDYGKAIDHSRKTADRMHRGVTSLMKKNQITVIPGRGRLAGANAVEVSGEEDRVVQAAHIVLATGSSEWVPPGVVVDGARVLTSREALESRVIPSRLLVVGAGAVGLEFAYVYAMYGSQVTVIEMADQVLPGADHEVAETIQREFRRKRINVQLGTRFEEMKITNGSVLVSVERGGDRDEIEAEQVLVAIGRRPLSENIGLDRVGIETDAKGFVPVDAHHRTTAPTVSAIGDLVGAPLLAHKASEEGIATAERVAGLERAPLDPGKIPVCIYCQPQVASIGRTEAEARAEFGDDLRVGKFPFTASGKAVAGQHTAGFVKILAEPRYGELVGAHIVGAGATELIAELALAMTLEATPVEIAGTVHAHPTLSEAILEAALSAEGRSINF